MQDMQEEANAPRSGGEKPALHGSAEAAAAIWDWRGTGMAPSDAPQTGHLRMRGIAQGLVGAGVGTGLYLFVSTTAGAVVALTGVTIALAGLLSPTGLFVLIDRGFQALARGLSRIITWAVLLPLFYLFFLPFGLVLRAGKRDRLQRWMDADAATYWEPRDGITAASPSRERQY
ncbi:MAG: hypothetical protein VCE43_00200 [Myxococcota bacterium]